MSNENDFENRIETKIDRLDSRLDDIHDVQTKQQASLEYHVMRTDLAEKRLEHVEETIVPLVLRANYIDGVLKFFGGVSVALGTAASAMKVLHIQESLSDKLTDLLRLLHIVQ